MIELTASDGKNSPPTAPSPRQAARWPDRGAGDLGVNGHIRSRRRRLSAADGYLAVAPAFFDRVERGLDISTPPDIERGRAFIPKMQWTR